MKEKILTILFIYLFLFKIPGYTLPGRSITWEPVAGARGYYLEIKDSKSNIIVSTTLEQNFYQVSQLEPGAYSFRIATVNILKEKGESTPWMDFVIEKLYIPELISVSQRQLIIPYSNKIMLSGKNLKPGGRVLLRGNGREIELSDYIIESDTKALFTYKPDSSSKGKYDLVVINRGDAESVLKDSIEIVELENAEIICFAAAGYSINIPFGRWGEYFQTSFAGADIYIQLSGRNAGFENILFEIALDAARFNNIDSLNKSSFSFAAMGIGAGYYFPYIPNTLELFFKIQLGGIYSNLILDEKPGDNSSGSTDLYTMAGGGIRVYLNDSFFLDTICGWKTVFYRGGYLQDMKLSLNCGYKF